MISLFKGDYQITFEGNFINSLNGAVELILEANDFGAASDWITLEDLSWLPNILVLFSPNKEERDSLEGVDEWEEKLLNKELLIDGIKVIQGSHKGDEDFAELILALSSNTCALEESNK